MLRYYTPQGEFNKILQFTSFDAVRKLNNVPSLTVNVPHNLRLDRFIEPSVTFDWTTQKSVCVVGGSGYGVNRNVVTVRDAELIAASLFGYAETFTDVDSTDTDALQEGGLTVISKSRTRPTLSGQYNGATRFGDVLTLPSLTTEYQNDSLLTLDYKTWLNELWRLKRVTLEENEARLEFRGLNSLLEDRIVLSTGQLSGKADNLAKEIVAAALTDGERAVPRLAVAPFLNQAPFVTVDDTRFRPVLDVLTDIADVSLQKGTALYFGIVADSAFNLRFETRCVPLLEGGNTQAIIDIDSLSVGGGDISIVPEWSVLG